MNKKDELNSLYGVPSQILLIGGRKFRKMGEIMTVVNRDDRVLFGVDTYGRIYRPSPPPTNTVLYKYETLRKRMTEGKSWWEEEINKIMGGEEK